MFKRATFAALAMALTAFAAAPASADPDIRFGLFFGNPGPVYQHSRPQYRPHYRPRRAFVPARVVARDVRRQGCNIASINQRGDRYVVRANCGRRGGPVRFIYSAYNGRLIDVDRRGGRRHAW